MRELPDPAATPTRPRRRPVMYQNWGKLLFLHWPTPVEPLVELLPAGVEPDLYRGQAWIGVVPFTMWGVRPAFLPPFPGLSAFHEINVRTYVRVDGVPGVWFFSLDASSAVAVYAARLAYHLPYFSAEIALEHEDHSIRYRSRRTHRDAPPAHFEATWSPLEPLPQSRPGSLEHFVTERYCLFTRNRETIFRGRIHHPPWPLRRARVDSLDSTMVEAIGLPSPCGEPLAYHADELAVEIWPLEAPRAEGRGKRVEAAGRPEPVTAPP